MKKRFLAAVLCLILALALLPGTALAAGPELVLWDNAANAPAVPGTDYTYDAASGVLTIIRAGDYTLSMATPGSSTDHRVSVKAEGTKLTLDNVHIEGSFDASSPDFIFPLDIFDAATGGVGNTDACVLTLKGESVLKNTKTGDNACGMRPGGRTRIKGDGRLTIDVPNASGTGVAGIQTRKSMLVVDGGTIRISAQIGIDQDNGSQNPGQELVQNTYVQTGGAVDITAGTGGISLNAVTLSGGDLNIHCAGAVCQGGISVPYGATVSGGNLNIDGAAPHGIASNRSIDSTGSIRGTGRISFTGGVTDIALRGASAAAVESMYSIAPNQFTSSVPPYPSQPITLGGNMRATLGGSIVWSEWLVPTDPDDDWNAISTFSTTGTVTISDTGFPGASNHVRIEPISGATAAPKTGDGAVPLLWLGLLLLSGAGLTASAALKRRRHN